MIRVNNTIPPAKMSLNLSFYVLFKLQSTFLDFAFCVRVCVGGWVWTEGVGSLIFNVCAGQSGCGFLLAFSVFL